MKSLGAAATTAAKAGGGVGGGASAERGTRGQVARLILELGPATAATLGGRLGLTPAAIRRHLENLIADGMIEMRTARSYGNRGRGRPAKVFVVTDAGRSAFEHTYDDLATSALRFIEQTGGPEAVAEFARQQVSELERRYAAVLAEADATLPAKVQALAEALSADGYAAAAGPAPAIGPAKRRQRLADLPAPLPGRARGGRVPAALRGGDRGIRSPARRPGATAGDDRARRRDLHDARDMHGSNDDERHESGGLPPMTTTANDQLEGLGTYKFGWSDTDVAGASAKRGLSEEVVRDISARKNEPEWMLENRLKGLKYFGRKPMPAWGSDLSGIDFDNIKYFVRSTEKQAESWDDLPADIKNTYDRLGIPEAEKQRLIAGVAAQYESEVVYHKIREDLEEKGVIFLDTDSALKQHPELFKEYYGTVIPAGDNKFAALNTSVWSGGSFIYVPPGVHVEIPLQAYFRINTENMGQFERTLIIVDEGAYVHYVEGCTAPIYKSDSLHSAVVEIIVKKDARCRYTTIQNWSNNVYNLVTKRAVCQAGATMEWIDGNIGSKVTMKYPAVYLMGEHAKGETLSVAFAGAGQHQDAGAKMVHCAPNTSSTIVSKSVARGGGRTSYRGLINVQEGATHSKSTVKCDALLVDTISRSDTYPYNDIREDDVEMGHEATVSKISADQLFYLMSRGLTEDEAMAMIVRGFVEPIARELPMEYALELNRLIELQMEGAVG